MESSNHPQHTIDSKITDEQRFTGSQINYYFICKRKLWLFSHNIELEPESDLVKLGKLLHENSYQRKMKEVQVDRIKVDFLETKRSVSNVQSNFEKPLSPEVQANIAQNGTRIHTQRIETKNREVVIHEIKRSKKMQDAHVFQLLYYMYYLNKNYGVSTSHGVLHYPLLKQNVDVPLSADRVNQLEEALRGIAAVNSMADPPKASRKRYCRSCAYQDLCWG